jgi:outer membrane immunogenic protein
MRFVKIILGAALLGATASPAFADEIRPYVGAIVGYDHVKITLDPFDPEYKDGVIYGGVIGADYMFMKTNLLGVEGEVSGASTKESATDGVDSASLKAGRDLYVGVRTGFVIAPHVLAYV